MAKKLSITIAGAVSLGSYESGVAFEILDAIAQHNTWVDAGNPGERIEVDVLTGASAGGMTVSMVAQRLLFDGRALTNPYDNPLFNAWVKEVDITGLLARDSNEPADHSFLSSDFVVGISKKYLTARYDTAPPPPAQPHPALAADGKLHLGLSLSNLNGVDYDRPTMSGGKFTYTEHADQQLVSLDHASDRGDIWEMIRFSAVSCGAFPFAFRVQDLLRNIADYPGTGLDRSLWGGAESRFFTYTDGGVFQNQPIGMAKNFVDQMTDGATQAASRAYLFIAPDPKRSAEVPFTPDAGDPSQAQFNSACADYLTLTKRLAGSIYDQSGFRDWIVAEDVNARIKRFDGQAYALLDLFSRGNLTEAVTEPVSSALLDAVFAAHADSLGSPDQERARLRTIYADDLAKARLSPPQADAWVDAVLVLEVAAGLHRKEEMYIYDFVADEKKLAGNDLEAFGGFFDVAYRKHDYDYGRTVAQQRLGQYMAKGKFFEGLHWTPRPIDAIDTSLDNLTMKQMDSGKRHQLCSQICAAAEDELARRGVNWIERKLIVSLLLDHVLKKLLGL